MKNGMPCAMRAGQTVRWRRRSRTRLLRAGRREDDGISGANRDFEQGEAAREHSAGKETGSSAIHNVHQPPKQASAPCRLACGGERPHPGPRWARSETARGGEKYRTRVFRRFRTLPRIKKTTETRARTVAWRLLKRREVTGVRDRARRARARDAHACARGFVAEASRRRDSRDATRLDYRLFSRRKPVGSMFLKTAIKQPGARRVEVSNRLFTDALFSTSNAGTRRAPVLRASV